MRTPSSSSTMSLSIGSDERDDQRGMEVPRASLVIGVLT
jgi:hypothetical protein